MRLLRANRHQGPPRRRQPEAGYIVRSPILDPEANTLLQRRGSPYIRLDDEDGKKAWIPFIIGGLGIGLLLWKTATGLF